MKMLDDNSCRTAHNAILNVSTIFDKSKFSSCQIPYTNNILHHMSSYYFLSHKKLLQAGNFNVNVRPDLLYFSIWGIYSNIPKHNLWQVKIAKSLCTSLRRLVWWNAIHSTKISVVLLDLKSKGQNILNTPRVSIITCNHFAVWGVEIEILKKRYIPNEFFYENIFNSDSVDHNNLTN